MSSNIFTQEEKNKYKHFTLKSEKPSKSATQEWWTFRDKWGHTEVVVRNWGTGHPVIKGNQYFIHELQKRGILKTECQITSEDKKDFYNDLDKAQTNKTYAKPIDMYELG